MKRSYTKEQKEWIVQKLPYYSPILIADMFKEHFNQDIRVDTIRNIKRSEQIKSNYDKKQYKERNKKELYETLKIKCDGEYLDFVRIGPRKYQLKNRFVWEQYHKRKVPANYVVVFLDKDKTNYNIDNLALVKRSTMSYMIKKEIEPRSRGIIKASDMCLKLDVKVKKAKRCINHIH